MAEEEFANFSNASQSDRPGSDRGATESDDDLFKALEEKDVPRPRPKKAKRAKKLAKVVVTGTFDSLGEAKEALRATTRFNALGFDEVDTTDSGRVKLKKGFTTLKEAYAWLRECGFKSKGVKDLPLKGKTSTDKMNGFLKHLGMKLEGSKPRATKKTGGGGAGGRSQRVSVRCKGEVLEGKTANALLKALVKGEGFRGIDGFQEAFEETARSVFRDGRYNKIVDAAKTDTRISGTMRVRENLMEILRRLGKEGWCQTIVSYGDSVSIGDEWGGKGRVRRPSSSDKKKKKGKARAKKRRRSPSRSPFRSSSRSPFNVSPLPPLRSTSRSKSRSRSGSGSPSNLEKVLETTGLRNVQGKQIMVFQHALRPLLLDAFNLGGLYCRSNSGKGVLLSRDAWLKTQPGDLAKFMQDPPDSAYTSDDE